MKKVFKNTFVLSLCILATGAIGAQTYVTSKPATNAGPYRNPYRGWNTKSYDPAQPTYASIAGLSIVWKDYEPVKDQYDWAKMDAEMERAGAKGNFININMFSDKLPAQNLAPAWVYGMVGKKTKVYNGTTYSITDCNDADYLYHALDFMQDFYAHYADNKRIHSFNLGWLGYYGEWSKWPFTATEFNITEASKKQLIDGFIKYKNRGFMGARYTKEVILQNYKGQAISFGDGYFRPNHSHWKEFVDNLGDWWKYGPICGETPPDVTEAEFNSMYTTSTGIDMLKAGRYSNMKGVFSHSTNATYKNGFNTMARSWGYVFELNEITYAKTSNGNFNVTVKGRNKGVAPFYYKWDVQIGILDASNNEKSVNTFSVDPRAWSPGANFTFTGAVGSSVSDGTYKLGIRIIYAGASVQATAKWKELDARNAYIVFANNMTIVDGLWGSDNKFHGGWAIIDNSITFSESGGGAAQTIVQMVKSNSTGFAIDGGNGGADNQAVYLFTQNPAQLNQQWIEIDRGSGYFSYQKRNTSFCLDGGNGGADNQVVKLFTCSSAQQNQHWKKVAATGGFFRLEKRNAVGFSIDGGNGGSDKQGLKLFTTSTTNQNQQWKFNVIKSAEENVMPEQALPLDISVFPNPAGEKILIGIPGNMFGSQLNLYNNTGKLIISKTIQSTVEQIDISGLHVGLYLVQVQHNGASQVKKFIKQ